MSSPRASPTVGVEAAPRPRLRRGHSSGRAASASTAMAPPATQTARWATLTAAPTGAGSLSAACAAPLRSSWPPTRARPRLTGRSSRAPARVSRPPTARLRRHLPGRPDDGGLLPAALRSEPPPVQRLGNASQSARACFRAVLPTSPTTPPRSRRRPRRRRAPRVVRRRGCCAASSPPASLAARAAPALDAGEDADSRRGGRCRQDARRGVAPPTSRLPPGTLAGGGPTAAATGAAGADAANSVEACLKLICRARNAERHCQRHMQGGTRAGALAASAAAVEARARLDRRAEVASTAAAGHAVGGALGGAATAPHARAPPERTPCPRWPTSRAPTHRYARNSSPTARPPARARWRLGERMHRRALASGAIAEMRAERRGVARGGGRRPMTRMR